MAIATSTFLRDIVLFLRNTLRTTVTDPITRTDNSFVMTSFPKRNTQYPLITVRNTGCDTRRLGIGSETIWINVNIEVRVFARNSKECDSLTEDVVNTLRSAQFGSGSTNDEQIYGFNLTSLNYLVDEEGDQNIIHSKILEFAYNAVLS